MTPYIITLNDPLRIQSINRTLAKQKIQANLWSGIRHEKPHVGIMRAHKQIVAHAKASRLEAVCIMEDDCLFPAEDGWDWFLHKYSKDCGIFFGGTYCREILDYETIRKPVGMHCYIIQNWFYDTFLSLGEDKHLDFALHGRATYGLCYPMAAIQRPGYSDNNKADANHNTVLEAKQVYGGIRYDD
jgi:hypothetical protein